MNAWDPDLTHRHSGISVVFGHGTIVPVRDQERIATEYLVSQQAALTELVAFPGVERVVLCLELNVAIHDNTVAFGITAPAPLMRIALQIGITITWLVNVERCEGPAPRRPGRSEP
jgi:hypothetical protein